MSPSLIIYFLRFSSGFLSSSDFTTLVTRQKEDRKKVRGLNSAEENNARTMQEFKIVTVEREKRASILGSYCVGEVRGEVMEGREMYVPFFWWNIIYSPCKCIFRSLQSCFAVAFIRKHPSLISMLCYMLRLLLFQSSFVAYGNKQCSQA